MQDVRISNDSGYIGTIYGVERMVEDANGNCGAECWHFHGKDYLYLAGFSAHGLKHDFPNPEREGYEK